MTDKDTVSLIVESERSRGIDWDAWAIIDPLQDEWLERKKPFGIVAAVLSHDEIDRVPANSPTQKGSNDANI